MASFLLRNSTYLDLSDDDIIDSHTHCGGVLLGNLLLRSYPYCQNTQDLVMKMENQRVSYSVCFPFPLGVNPIEGLTPQLYNELLALEVSTFGKGVLFPFAFIRLDDTLLSQLRFIEKLQKKYPFYGIKIYPPCDIYNINEKYIEDILPSFLRLYGFPVIFHTSFNEFGNSIELLKFAAKFPDIKILLAHAARFDINALMEIKNLPNVYLDSSPLNMLCAVMRRAKIKNPDKYKDFNFDNPKSILEQLVAMFPKQLLWGTDIPATFLTNFTPKAVTQFSYEFTYEAEVALLRTLPKSDVQCIANFNTTTFLFC